MNSRNALELEVDQMERQMGGDVDALTINREGRDPTVRLRFNPRPASFS